MFESMKPPTDNLYKFIAIAGLLLMALGVLQMSKIDTSEKELLVQAIKLSAEIDQWDRENTRMIEKREAARKRFSRTLNQIEIEADSILNEKKQDEKKQDENKQDLGERVLVVCHSLILG